LLISFSFFFYCYAHTRVLHSFPTRRSSDLIVVFPVAESPTTPRMTGRGMCPLSSPRRRRPASPPALRCCRPRPRHCPRLRPRHRSEEHTSELQSRSDLVCRLLLEKKKKQLQ